MKDEWRDKLVDWLQSAMFVACGVSVLCIGAGAITLAVRYQPAPERVLPVQPPVETTVTVVLKLNGDCPPLIAYPIGTPFPPRVQDWMTSAAERMDIGYVGGFYGGPATLTSVRAEDVYMPEPKPVTIGAFVEPIATPVRRADPLPVSEPAVLYEIITTEPLSMSTSGNAIVTAYSEDVTVESEPEPTPAAKKRRRR